MTAHTDARAEGETTPTLAELLDALEVARWMLGRHASESGRASRIEWLKRHAAALLHSQEDTRRLDAIERGEWDVAPQLNGGWVVSDTIGSSLTDFSERVLARTRGPLRMALDAASAPPGAEDRHANP